MSDKHYEWTKKGREQGQEYWGVREMKISGL